jgi:hypothetical protein
MNELLIYYTEKMERCLERGDVVQADFYEELCWEIEQQITEQQISESDQTMELSA